MSYDLEFNRALAAGPTYAQKFLLWPRQWKSYRSATRLTWHKIRYTPSRLRLLPQTTGVYAFTICPGVGDTPDFSYLVYIGKAEDQTLRQRCGQYRYEPRKPKPRPLIVKMLRLWGRHLHLYFASVPTNVGAVEDALLAAFMPPFNTDLPGKLAAIGKVIYHT